MQTLFQESISNARMVLKNTFFIIGFSSMQEAGVDTCNLAGEVPETPPFPVYSGILCVVLQVSFITSNQI